MAPQIHHSFQGQLASRIGNVDPWLAGWGAGDAPQLAGWVAGKEAARPHGSLDPQLLSSGVGSFVERPAHQLVEQETGQHGLMGLPTEEREMWGIGGRSAWDG